MKTIWIIGYGGITKALYNIFISKHYSVKIFSRSKDIKAIDYTVIDVSNESEVIEWLNSITDLPDIIINTCGLLHDDATRPEKSISQLQTQWLEKSIKANVLTNLYILKEITKKLTLKSSLIYCAFSARVGSISDNHLGGWYSYRMTKAMLHMLIKTSSREWAFKAPDAAIFCYHPGTVDTKLSKPFQAKMQKHSLFTPEEAGTYFYNVLSQINDSYHGAILDWKGAIISP